jgi:transcriptional regulator with XRE-family HTH domain
MIVPGQKHEPPDRPGQVLGRRVREERTAARWSQRDLVDRLDDLGYPISRPTLIRLEAGEGRAPLDLVIAIAAALGVTVADLIAPLPDEGPMALTPNLVYSAPLAREWVRGDYGALLPMTVGVDVDKLTDDELRKLLLRQKTRQMSPAERERMYPWFAETIDFSVKFIRNPRFMEEETGGDDR